MGETEDNSCEDGRVNFIGRHVERKCWIRIKMEGCQAVRGFRMTWYFMRVERESLCSDCDFSL